MPFGTVHDVFGDDVQGVNGKRDGKSGAKNLGSQDQEKTALRGCFCFDFGLAAE